MILLAFATSIVLLAGDPAPQYNVTVGTTHGLLIEAEAYPIEITAQSILPSGQTIQVMQCNNTNTCGVNVEFPQCGLFQFPGVVSYVHMDPAGGGPYVYGVNAAVIVAGCDIFADGFETGTTEAWSKTGGGVP